MIEFALALPLLLVLVAGLVEVGRGLIVYTAVERAVASGARLLARTPAPACRASCPPRTERILASVATRIRTETGLVPASVTIAGPDEGVVTLATELDVEPFAFRGWSLGATRIVVSHRERHVAP